tara:strand:+ start:1017 stop:4220 length:3204 start_codon:yes stop_codon:yes gene_type:complete
MTRSFTPNVILTKSAEAIDELFFAANTYRNRFSESVKRLDNELIKSFIVSPLENTSFLSMEYNFPRSDGGDVHPTVSMTFVESNEIIEYFALNQGPLSNIIRSRFQGSTQDKKFVSQAFGVTLESLNQSFNQYFLSFGVGENLNQWAGPFRLTLQDADIILNSDGVRQLELFFVPDTKGFTQINSKIATVRDYRQFKNKLKASESKKSTPTNTSNPLPIPLEDLDKDVNDYLRYTIHTYVQNLTTDGGVSPNVITCIPQDLSKVGYKYSTTVKDTRDRLPGNNLNRVRQTFAGSKATGGDVSFDEFYTFGKVGPPGDLTKPSDFYLGRSQTKCQIAALFNKFGMQIQFVEPNDPFIPGIINPFGASVDIQGRDALTGEDTSVPQSGRAAQIINSAKDTQEQIAATGNALEKEITSEIKREFETAITQIAAGGGRSQSEINNILNSIVYPIQIGTTTNMPGVGNTINPGGTALALGNSLFGNPTSQQLLILETACFQAKTQMDKAKESVTRGIQKKLVDKQSAKAGASGVVVRASSLERDDQGFNRGEGFTFSDNDGPFVGPGPYAGLQRRRAQSKYTAFATIQDPAYKFFFGTREEYDNTINDLDSLLKQGYYDAEQVKEYFNGRRTRGPIAEIIQQRINRVEARKKLQRDLQFGVRTVPKVALIRMKGKVNYDKDEDKTLLDPLFTFYEALKTGSNGQPVDDFRLVYESDKRILKVMQQYGIVSDINQPLLVYGDVQAILYFLYGHDNEGTFKPEGMFDYLNQTIDWDSYRKDIKELQFQRGLTSSFNEQIDHALIGKVNKTNLGVKTEADNESIFFQYNVANANVQDVSYSFKGYVADMYSLPMENAIQFSSLQAQADLIAKDDDASINAISRVIENLPGFKSAATSIDSVQNLLIGRLLSKDKKLVEATVKELSKVPGFTLESKKDFITFIQTVSYLAFIRGGGKPTFMTISDDDSLAEKYSHVLKRLYQRVVGLELKTLPFFNQVIYIDKPCKFFGIQNDIKGGAFDGILVPSYLNGEYKIVGAKHVINNNADAYSEFSLVKKGFLGGKTTLALGEVFKSLTS